MKKKLIGIIVGAVVTATTVTAVAITTAPEAKAGGIAGGGCPDVAYFAIGGNGDPKSVKVPYVPAGYRVNIEYPADVLRGDESRRIAIEKLNYQARNFRTMCSDARIEVIGYSLGASAGSIAVDEWQLDPVMNKNVIATFYGNPRQPIGPGGWGGIETVGLPNIPFIYTWRGPTKTGPIVVNNICNEKRDFVCSTPAPIHKDLVGALGALQGYLTGDHLY